MSSMKLILTLFIFIGSIPFFFSRSRSKDICLLTLYSSFSSLSAISLFPCSTQKCPQNVKQALLFPILTGEFSTVFFSGRMYQCCMRSLGLIFVLNFLQYNFLSISGQISLATGYIFLKPPRWLFSQTMPALRLILAASLSLKMFFSLWSLALLLRNISLSSHFKLRSMNVSNTRHLLMTKSRGESVQKLGEWFTSSSQGLKLLSINMSNPRISKHTDYPSISQSLQFLQLSNNFEQQARIVFTITQSICQRNYLILQPLFSRDLQAAAKDLLWPAKSSSISLFETQTGFSLFIAQLVKCMFIFFLLCLFGGQYGFVASRVRPSSNLKIFRGAKLLTSTQTLRSYLHPSIICGLLMYSCTTEFSLGISLMSFVRKIPFPCELEEGLTISHCFGLRLSLNSSSSSGIDQVSGKKSQSSGMSAFIFLRLLLSRFFLPSYCELGKWLMR